MVDLGTGTGRELLPLALGSVTSYARSFSEIEEAYDFHVHFLDCDLQTVLPGWDSPSIVAITFYVWRKSATLRLAKAIKQLYPNCRIILGGPSVPGRPDRIDQFMKTHSYVDYLVHNEGEVTFADLLKTLDEKRDVSTVEGITFRCPDVTHGYVTTPPRARLSDLNDIPSPFFNGFFDDIIKRYSDRLTGALFETNRGCPFSCSFCDWGSATMSKVRCFDLDRVFDEIEWMGKNKFFYAYGTDANFGIFFDRDFEIAQKICEVNKKMGFPGYLRISWTKNNSEKILQISETLRTSEVSNLVSLSIQSFHPGTLEAIKRKNIKHDEFLKLKSNFNELGQDTYTEIILGLPNETYETFVDGLSKTMTCRLQDHLNIYPCSMIENAAMATAESREKFGLETRFCFVGFLRTAKLRTANYKVGASDGWAFSAEPLENPSTDNNDSGRLFDCQYIENTYEVEEIIVGTSTMPVEDWRRSYIYASVASAMYFFRLAFFLMQYLHREFNVEHSDFLEYIIGEVSKNQELFPRIAKGINHLETQIDVILGNGTANLSIEGYDDRAFQPREAAMTIFLHDANAFYRELEALTDRYLNKREFEVQSSILSEIIAYQKAKIPIFPVTAQTSHLFDYNIPDYFDAVTAQEDVPAIVKKTTNMEILLPDDLSDDHVQFALDRVDMGITVKLNDSFHSSANRRKGAA